MEIACSRGMRWAPGVEAQPGVSEVTGGRVAAPIARTVMEAVLGLSG